MTPDEQYAYAKEHIAARINSWADLYAHFDGGMLRVRTTMHPALVFDSLFTMYAFIQALKELPDEGDIKKIVDKMLRIMVYEGVEKLGTKINIVNPDDINKMLTEQALDQMSSFTTAELPSGYKVH